jgi:hypothetical protein
MTIIQLSERMTDSLDRIKHQEVLLVELPKPERLKKRLAVITEHFDKQAEKAPRAANILISLEKIKKNQDLTSRDWKNIAWGLSTTSIEHEKKYIFTDIGQKALQRLITLTSSQMSDSFYKALLFSYFSIEKHELTNNDNTNWETLRAFLILKMPSQTTNKVNQKKWLSKLSEYKEILTKKPFENLSSSFLNDEKNFFENIEDLKIASASWFWTDLIINVVETACKMHDTDFHKNIDRLIDLGKKEPIYLNKIITDLLNRYSESAYANQANKNLKKISIEKFGNPLSEASPSWNSFPTHTRRMVKNWFVRADLEAFFTTFNTHADTRRFDYWLRFINQISYTQLILGTNSSRSPRQDHREFRALNNSRFSYLSGGTQTNNSFIIKISGIFVVEFSDNGNACYFYKDTPLKKPHRHIDIKELKNKEACIYSLNHRGDWEYTFDSKLAILGIFRDTV